MISMRSFWISSQNDMWSSWIQHRVTLTWHIGAGFGAFSAAHVAVVDIVAEVGVHVFTVCSLSVAIITSIF